MQLRRWLFWNLRQEVKRMVNFYVMMIHKGAIALDNVPDKWRGEVEKIIKAEEK